MTNEKVCWAEETSRKEMGDVEIEKKYFKSQIKFIPKGLHLSLFHRDNADIALLRVVSARRKKWFRMMNTMDYKEFDPDGYKRDTASAECLYKTYNDPLRSEEREHSIQG